MNFACLLRPPRSLGALSLPVLIFRGGSDSGHESSQKGCLVGVPRTPLEGHLRAVRAVGTDFDGESESGHEGSRTGDIS